MHFNNLYDNPTDSDNRTQAVTTSRSIDVLVAGAPGLAEALRASGRFARVLACSSTSEMKDLISKNLLGEARPDSFVFMFSPLLTEDVPGIKVESLVAKLTTDDFRVVVLDINPLAREIVRRNPAAGLFSPPFTLNTVLGGLSGTGVGLIEPVSASWAHSPFEPSDAAAVAALVSAQSQEPEEAAWPQVQNAPWSQNQVVTPSPVAPAPTAGGWGSAPQAAPLVESNAPWGATTPVSPPPADAPAPTAWGADASTSQPSTAAPAHEPVATPWGAETSTPAPSSSPWDAASTQPESPWGTGTSQPAASPWDAVAPAPATPWGADPSHTSQPATAPWGAEPAQTSSDAAWGSDTTGWSQAATPQQPAWETTFSDVPASMQGFGQPVLQERNGFVIAVAVAKGGAGKSTLTLNLGVWLGLRLRESGKTVCIVDANYQQADIGRQINRYTPNIVSLAKNEQDQTPQRISNHLLRMPEHNVSYLLGPTGVDDANPLWLTPKLYSHAVQVLRSLFDYVIIDTPVAEFHNEIFDNFIIPQVDFIAVPVTPDIVTLQSTDNWLQAITQSQHQGGKGFERDRIGIILNMQQDGVGMDVPEVQRSLASWHFLGSVPFSKVWQAARNEEEIVAMRNYAEVNASFSRILGAITQDPVVLAGQNVAAPIEKKSRWSRKKR